MKKWFFIGAGIALCMIFCGCSAAEPVWETVDDELVESVSYFESTYRIVFDVPEGMERTACDPINHSCEYRQADGNCKINTAVFLSDSAGSAIRMVSGQEPDKMELVETKRFDMPEYRFAWYETDESGTGWLCRADLLQDGKDCYCLSFRVREEAAKQYDTMAEQVFATFGLYGDEL